MSFTKSMSLALLAAALCLTGFLALAGESDKIAEWGYTGQKAPPHWGELDKKYHACTHGQKQSPVNIGQMMQTDLPPIGFDYQDISLTVTNTGHTVRINVPEGNTIIGVDGQEYTLRQIHFHTPSEHYVDGVPYPMEAHFIHQAADGALAVVGVMMKVGQANETVETIWSNIPPEEEAMKADETLALPGLLPAQGNYFTYEGSLTTPPCTEGVRWLLMQQPITISAGQLRAFQAHYALNARPIQPLNGRVVKGD